MRVITITELRNHLGKYLRAIKKGRSFLVSHRGVVVAKMTPISKNDLAG
jgi:prevent-host-death family protein